MIFQCVSSPYMEQALFKMGKANIQRMLTQTLEVYMKIYLPFGALTDKDLRSCLLCLWSLLLAHLPRMRHSVATTIPDTNRTTMVGISMLAISPFSTSSLSVLADINSQVVVVTFSKSVVALMSLPAVVSETGGSVNSVVDKRVWVDLEVVVVVISVETEVGLEWVVTMDVTNTALVVVVDDSAVD